MEPMRVGSIRVALFLMAVTSLPIGAQRTNGTGPVPGVAESLARERAARVSDLRYDLSFIVPVARSEHIAGRVVITFSIGDVNAPLQLDFEPNGMGAVRLVEAGGVPVDAPLQNGHIVLPASVLRSGTNRVTIEFDAGDASLNRNDDFLYTIFVPARAHEAFPCFDQPDLKARWTPGPGRSRRLGDAGQRRRRPLASPAAAGRA